MVLSNPGTAPNSSCPYLQRDTTIAQFRPDIEYTIHGAVHVGLGGDMALPTFSQRLCIYDAPR